jgi:hypothetical protein
MTTFADRPLEEQIAQWRAYVRRRQALHGPDVEELEGHLRDQVVALTEAGLTGDEAFLVAVKRMGSLDALSREFARAHSERLWKQLVLAPDAADESANTGRVETLVVLGLALAAAIAVKVPALFGLRPDGGAEMFYLRNASLFVFPLLTAYFLWKRGSGLARGMRLALPLAAGALFANVFPFRAGGDTETLTVLHLPIALWLVVGFACVHLAMLCVAVTSDRQFIKASRQRCLEMSFAQWFYKVDEYVHFLGIANRVWVAITGKKDDRSLPRLVNFQCGVQAIHIRHQIVGDYHAVIPRKSA